MPYALPPCQVTRHSHSPSVSVRWGGVQVFESLENVTRGCRTFSVFPSYTDPPATIISLSSGVIDSLGSRRSIPFSLTSAADSHFSPSVDSSTRICPSPPTWASASRKVQYHLSCQRIRSVKALCLPWSQIFLTETISGPAAWDNASGATQARIATRRVRIWAMTGFLTSQAAAANQYGVKDLYGNCV